VNSCFECGGEAHHDHHVVPRSRGGTKTVPLCEDCHGKAHERRMNTRALVRDALQSRKERGMRTGGIPRGYAVGHDSKTLVEDDREQLLISKVLAFRAAGMTLRGIAEVLEEQGYKTRKGKPYSFVAISEICRKAKKTAA